MWKKYFCLLLFSFFLLCFIAPTKVSALEDGFSFDPSTKEGWDSYYQAFSSLDYFNAHSSAISTAISMNTEIAQAFEDYKYCFVSAGRPRFIAKTYSDGTTIHFTNQMPTFKPTFSSSSGHRYLVEFSDDHKYFGVNLPHKNSSSFEDIDKWKYTSGVSVSTFNADSFDQIVGLKDFSYFLKGGPSDVLSNGASLSILKPVEGSKITGYMQYQSNDVNLFDIVVKGKFVPKYSFLKGDKYHKNSIVTTFCMYAGTYNSSNLALQKFNWIKSPSDCKSGEMAEFEIVMTDVVHKQSNVEIGVDISVESDQGWIHLSNKVSNVSFTQDYNDIEQNGYKPPNPDNGESDGSDSGHGWDTSPSAPDSSGSILDWIKYYVDCVIQFFRDIFTSIGDIFSGIGSIASNLVSTCGNLFKTFDSVFSFLPVEVRTLIYSAITVLVGIAIIKFLRG